MRRTLVIVLLSCVTVFAVASCGSSSDTSTSGSTTTTGAGGKTSTTKANGKDSTKPTVNPDGPKCSSITNFLTATYYASTEGKTPANKDKATKQLEAASAEVKKNLEQFKASVEAQVAYWKKVVNGGTPTDAEKAAQEKSKNEMNLFKNTNCKKDDAGTTTTTAKK